MACHSQCASHSLFGKPFLLSFLLVSLLIHALCTSALAAEPIGLRIELRGGILHVEWDSVPETVGATHFAAWQLFIHAIDWPP